MALYLKHNEGIVSLYGHLGHLSDLHQNEAAWQLFKLLNNREFFSIYYPPGLFEVNQGDRIAYTGERGSGSSHLHFETWDKDQNYINLLTHRYFWYEDAQPPTIDEVFVITPGVAFEKNTVEQSCKPDKTGEKTIHTEKKKDHIEAEFSCKGTIPVDKKFVLKVSAYDNSNARNKLGIYTMRLILDNEVIYEFKFDRMKKREKYRVSQILDSKTKWWPTTYVYRMFDDSKRSLPDWIQRQKNEGWVDSSEWKENSYHQLKLEAEDYMQNLSTVTIVVQKKKGHSPRYGRAKYNLAAGKSHTVTVKNLVVKTPRMPRRAWLSVEELKGKKAPSGIKGLTPVYRISYNKNYYRKLPLTLLYKASPSKKISFYSPWGKIIETKYDTRLKAYVIQIQGSTSLLVGADYSKPSFLYSMPYGPLEQDRMLVRIDEKGAGVNPYSIVTYINGKKLSREEQKEWNIRFDHDRKAIVIPTGFRPKRNKFQKGSLHHLWLRIADEAGNYSDTWRGYINLNL